MERRLVRYTELKPCTTAFIDSCTPGSERKETATIIGPGVSESPQQHVHIDLPHAFNIGDDPGHITWAPYIFEAAARFGLVFLLANGRLIDANRQPVPADAVRMRPATVAGVAGLVKLDVAALSGCVVRADDLASARKLSTGFAAPPT